MQGTLPQPRRESSTFTPQPLKVKTRRLCSRTGFRQLEACQLGLPRQSVTPCTYCSNGEKILCYAATVCILATVHVHARGGGILIGVVHVYIATCRNGKPTRSTGFPHCKQRLSRPSLCSAPWRGQSRRPRRRGLRCLSSVFGVGGSARGQTLYRLSKTRFIYGEKRNPNVVSTRIKESAPTGANGSVPSSSVQL